MEEDLTKYIYEKLIADAQHYQWRMVYDQHKKALEIYFTVSVEAEKGQYVQDMNGNVNRSEQMYFEEVICFYDEKNSQIVPTNYLYAVPFDPEIGIEQGQVDGVLKQLNIVASNTKSRLREFLLEDSQKEFSMRWHEKNMYNTMETMRETNRYETKPLTFSEKKDQSLVDQFKEEQHEGLERI